MEYGEYAVYLSYTKIKKKKTLYSIKIYLKNISIHSFFKVLFKLIKKMKLKFSVNTTNNSFRNKLSQFIKKGKWFF